MDVYFLYVNRFAWMKNKKSFMRASFDLYKK
jgi:hypothetical protein